MRAVSRTRRQWLVAVLTLLVLVLGLLIDSDGEAPRTGGPPAYPHQPAPPPVAIGGPDTPVLAEVFYRTFLTGGRDQYVRLVNPTLDDVDLTGWSLSDGKDRAIFPPGATLPAGGSVYVAHSGKAFLGEHGFRPDFVFTGDEPRSQRMTLAGPPPYRPHTRGQVELRDGGGALVDVVPYGNSRYDGPYWRGPPVPQMDRGDVMHRARSEVTVGPGSAGAYTRPTRTAADWQQGREWVTRRLLRPGQSFLSYPTFLVWDTITAFTSPDSSLRTLERLIDNAWYSIDINIYIAHQPALAARLVAALERGVAVRLLLEGQPMGGVDDETRWFAQQIHDAGGEVRFMRGDSDRDIHRRYVFDHAKYGIVDGDRSFVLSENWGKHSIPADPSLGNRGWGVIVADPALAAYLTDAFDQDWNPAILDTVAYNAADPRYGAPPPGFQPEPDPRGGSYEHPFAARRFPGPHRVTPVFAPDHSLYAGKGITGLIRSAHRRLLVEQQYIYLTWGGRQGTVEETPDLYLEEVLAAARRGVQVRVLLDDDSEYREHGTPTAPPAPRNAETCAYINRLARGEGLDAACRILDVDASGLDKIHNKGVIADGQVLVSSINWSYNSPSHNRELGLIIESPALADHFAVVFDWDWQVSA